jgi:hypothetical protein
VAWDAQELERELREAALQREDAERTRDNVRQSRLNAHRLSEEDATRRARMRALLRRVEEQRDRLTAGPGAPGAPSGRLAEAIADLHCRLRGSEP